MRGRKSPARCKPRSRNRGSRFAIGTPRRHWRRPALLALAATLAAGLVPASASGKAQVLTRDSSARNPDVVLDRAGTAHVVWATGEGLTYCQVPRDAKSCAATRPLALEHPLFGTEVPSINLLPSGELLITWEGHLASDPSWGAQVRVYALSSSDGGGTFAGPRAIADPASIWGYAPTGGPEVGPGGSNLSFAGVGGGANTPLRYSAVPSASSLPFADEGTDVTPAASLVDWSRGYSPSIAFVNPSTPIVASDAILEDRIFYRRWSGSGNVNDAGSWLPERSLPGAQPQLAGGPRGAYLIYKRLGPDEFFVARYNPSENAFDRHTRVSGDHGEGAYSGLLAQDGAGGLHAVFTEFVEKDRLLHRSSPDGRSWGQTGALVPDVATLPGGGDFPGDDFWDIRLDAGPKGSGAVVYSTNNGAGPILLSPFASARCKGRPATIAASGGPTNGTNGRDVIVGGAGRDVIRARDGSDLVCGGGGNDLILGGGGRDHLRGERGRDALYGQGGRDRLFGGPGADRLFGGPGTDQLVGGPGRDRIRQD